MNGAEIAAIIAAIGGLLTAVFAGWRALRGDKVSAQATEAATVLTGLQGLVTTLQNEVSRLQADADKHRKECTQERTDLRNQHYEEMRLLREEHRKDLAERDERIDELGAQVYFLQNRPPNSRERKTDK